MEGGAPVRPTIVLDGDYPAFVFEHFFGNDLMCGACQQSVLVRGYSPLHLIGIQIQCGRCGEVTETPDLEPGEVLPQQVVVLPVGDGGLYRIGAPLIGNRDVVIASDLQVEQSQQQSRPRTDELANVEFSTGGLARLQDRYDELTEGDFGRQLETVQRAVAARNPEADRDYPLPWALHHLRGCLADNILDLDRHSDYVAMCTIVAFEGALSSWGHNPRFAALARNWRGAGTFWHDVFQLSVGGHMFNSGNRVGIGLAIPGQPSPDLYVRTAALEKLYIEVKAPKALRWSRDNSFHERDMVRAVRKTLTSSVRQINSVRRGVLAVACCGDGEAFAREFRRIVGEVLRAKGRDRRGVAAMVPVTMIFPRRVGQAITPLGYRFETELNPFFVGDNPVRV